MSARQNDRNRPMKLAWMTDGQVATKDSGCPGQDDARCAVMYDHYKETDTNG